ncbi:MAG: tRNA guanosine(34) transglycosylase Tgt [Candidatus Brocadiae bacterium]|nr:tRNA guanosine(34) transglycosylase Tgt [Candidatus Brocadiia bacterium]
MFTVSKRDSLGRARAGTLRLAHGDVPTPAFMPVGTHAAVKGLTPDQLLDAGTSLLLCNAFHLSLRPGEDLIRRLGGLHAFMGWRGPILTDSGGYQVFSLGAMCELDDDGARFRSPVDGSRVAFTPERVVAIQEALGVDIMMPLDQPAGWPVEEDAARAALRRSLDWLRRSIRAKTTDQVLFGICHGSVFHDVRREGTAQVLESGVPGLAIGGLAVGEGRDLLLQGLDYALRGVPPQYPVYLMGVGTPSDIVEAIDRGVDMFDCVLPTRNGRTGWAWTSEGVLRIRNASFREDPRPLDPACDGPCCRVSRGYLRHLFAENEMLGPALISWHNIRHYQALVRGAREAILDGRWTSYRLQVLDRARRIVGAAGKR